MRIRQIVSALLLVVLLATPRAGAQSAAPLLVDVDWLSSSNEPHASGASRFAAAASAIRERRSMPLASTRRALPPV